MSYNILKRKQCPNETVTKLMNAVLIEGGSKGERRIANNLLKISLF